MKKIGKFIVSGSTLLALTIFPLATVQALEIKLINKNGNTFDEVSLYIDGRFACEAGKRSSCRAKASDGIHLISIKNANGKTVCQFNKDFGQGQDGVSFSFTYPDVC